MTKIGWTDVTWQVTRGCSIVSEGCGLCYAMRQAHRFSGKGRAYEGLTKMTSRGAVWTGEVRLVPDNLDQPFRWRKPRRVFVDSMSDLFHESIPDEYLDKVFATMALTDKHTYQVLTKRPERMAAYFADEYRWPMIEGAAQKIYHDRTGEDPSMWLAVHDLPNVQLGTSCENQETFDERVAHLLHTPAAVRFLSLEPLLGPIDTWSLRGPGNMFQWVIVGGESGPGARPCEVEWIRSIVEQCRAAEVPVFVKQDSGPRPGKQGRIPDALWVKEFPAGDRGISG